MFFLYGSMSDQWSRKWWVRGTNGTFNNSQGGPGPPIHLHARTTLHALHYDVTRQTSDH